MSDDDTTQIRRRRIATGAGWLLLALALHVAGWAWAVASTSDRPRGPLPDGPQPVMPR